MLISIENGIYYDDFVSMVCSKLNIHCCQSKLRYALAHDPFSFLPLTCEEELEKIICDSYK